MLTITAVNKIRHSATTISKVFLGAVIGLFVMAASATAQGVPSFVNLPEKVNGEAAILALADHLPDVAKAHGLTDKELKKKFREDSTLFVDETGHLLYIEEGLVENAETAADSSSAAPSEIPATEAFLLESKPGASKTIFLDFDGHVVTGTAWNSTSYLGVDPYYAQPFDLDGLPGTFNDTERLRIIGIWARVAEDYAPFDVNVTTKDPGDAALTRSSSTDNVYGSRALIVPTAPVCSSCGGIAYIGTFDNTGSYYSPAWVRANSLGSGNEKYTAEAISHEVGHNLGLYHDGKTDGTEYYAGHGAGDTGWAPIMGVGFYKNLSQWSRGEYSGANNTEDDYARINSNGLDFRADDWGDTVASAAAVLQTANSFSAAGIIETPEDIDFFRFTSGAGDVHIDVVPSEKGANLDIKAAVYNSSGSLLGQANPADFLYSGLIVSLPSDGTYYFSIEGVGKGDPLSTGYSDYGSLGRYSVTGLTTSSSNQPPVAAASASALSGVEPLLVSFSGAGSSDSDGSIASYQWDFGDGASASGVTAQHTFYEGTHSVTLTVFDDKGFADSDVLVLTVSPAPNVPPTAVAVYSAPTPIIAGKDAVSFSSSGSRDSDGVLVSYRWDFGDGVVSTSANPTHVYAAAGTYVVVVSVTDDEGASDSDVVTLTVESDPNFIAAPSSLVAGVVGSSVTFSWRDNSNNESGFKIVQILKVKGQVTYTTVATAAAGATSFVLSGVKDGSYRYHVFAFHASAQSAASNEVSVRVGTTKVTGKPPKN
jgi:PKD repeat protein